MTPALFDPVRHEPLIIEAWSTSDARICIEEIVNCAVQAYSPPHLFHPHPQDDFLTGKSIGTSPYVGAAGVFWGIVHLSAAGAVPDQREWVRPRLDAMIAANVDIGAGTGSLLFGGILALVLRAGLAPKTAAKDLDDVYACLTQASAGPVQEMMWGIPGGALLAEFLLRQTGDTRWQDLLRRQLDAVWHARIELPGIGLMWQEELYGSRTLYLGPVHGFAGQVLPLLRAFTLLSGEQQRVLRNEVPETLHRTALHDAQGINWPTTAVADWSQAPRSAVGTLSACLVQYCHGAPGIVTSFADIRTDILPGIDELMRGGGELIWNAGPLAKGSNLCHGTAGNGMAFLKQFARTGDQQWLERARAFAMHSIRQYRQAKHHYGQDRYSLWTGDMGLAVYLQRCLDEVPAFPTVDVF